MNIEINKANLNRIYQPSPEFFQDIEGRLVEKNGKKIQVQSQIEGKNVNYQIYLREEVDFSLGQLVKIDKNNIKSFTRTVTEVEEPVYIEEESESLSEIKENLEEEDYWIIDSLLEHGISLNMTNILAYKNATDRLGSISSKLDHESIVSLLDRGLDIEDMGLDDLDKALDQLDGKRSLLDSLKKSEISYKEAEKIAREIYGQRMGRDVYDTIIALKKQDIEINRENINRSLDLLAKLKDLENIRSKDYIEIIEKDIDFTINAIFNHKNSIRNSSIEKVQGDFYEILEETEAKNLELILEDLGLEPSQDNLLSLRDFIVNSSNYTKEKILSYREMKEALELVLSLNKEDLLSLNKSLDLENEDIRNIKKLIESGSKIGEETVYEDKLSGEDFLKDLVSISEKDLIGLIREGKDLTLENIKAIRSSGLVKSQTIEYRTLDMVKEIEESFRLIGDRYPAIIDSLDREGKNISLKTMKESFGLNQEGFRQENNPIYQEYLNLRSNLTVSMVKDSILLGHDLATMEISQVNKYVNSKITKYRKIQEDFTRSRENQDKIIPLIMKNDIDLNLGEINQIDSFLRGEQGLASLIKKALGSTAYSDKLKEGLREIKKDFEGGQWKAQDFNRSYERMMDFISDEKSFNEDPEANEERENFVKAMDKLNKRRAFYKIPISLAGDIYDLNVIIPSFKDLEKDKIDFNISLFGDKLGDIDLDLSLRSREMSLSFKKDNIFLRENIGYLRRSLENLGYSLEVVD